MARNTSTPISYSTTFPDASGAQKHVSFSGTASGTSLTGTLSVAGVAQQISATIGTDGSVSGTLLNADGSPKAKGSARPMLRAPR